MSRVCMDLHENRFHFPEERNCIVFLWAFPRQYQSKAFDTVNHDILIRYYGIQWHLK